MGRAAPFLNWPCSVEAGQIDLGRARRIVERIRETLIDRYREKEHVGQEGGGKGIAVRLSRSGIGYATTRGIVSPSILRIKMP